MKNKFKVGDVVVTNKPFNFYNFSNGWKAVYYHEGRIGLVVRILEDTRCMCKFSKKGVADFTNSEIKKIGEL